jgi:hypothetical protein
VARIADSVRTVGASLLALLGLGEGLCVQCSEGWDWHSGQSLGSGWCWLQNAHHHPIVVAGACSDDALTELRLVFEGYVTSRQALLQK